jgi:hypothetical protein
MMILYVAKNTACTSRSQGSWENFLQDTNLIIQIVQIAQGGISTNTRYIGKKLEKVLRSEQKRGRGELEEQDQDTWEILHQF